MGLELIVGRDGLVSEVVDINQETGEKITRPYKPHGNLVFVSPDNLLEEGEAMPEGWDRIVHWEQTGRGYKKIKNLEINGNQVLFHPKLKEIAEVRESYRQDEYDKVRSVANKVTVI